MIIALFSDMRVLLAQSIAAGAASLSDSSMQLALVLVLVVVDRRRPARARRRLGAVASRRPSAGAPDADDEVAEDLFGDQEAALELGDRLGRAPRTGRCGTSPRGSRSIG